MFPYRFDEAEPQPGSSTQQPAPSVQPTPYTLPTNSAPPQHTTPTNPSSTPRRKRRLGSAALLTLALTGTTVGGGVAGAVAATRWLVPEPTPTTSVAQPAAPVVAPQPIVAQSAPATNIAGAVFSRVNPAVVQIIATGETPNGVMPYGSGSGFVVDARGLILTNNHVVDNARSVSVRFSNGEQREAQVLGTDRGNDLAILKVDLPADVPVAPLGDSDQAQVGETAIAIGSPFGLDQTVTQGIISAVDRDWNPGNGRTRRDLLQTDAPINPGNSGGPLLNARGEVIGINTMIESPVRGSVGIGFAVPINTAKERLTQLETGAQLVPVWLGISGVELDATIAKDQGLTVDQGILVTSVVPNSPAQQAGLRGGASTNERIPVGGDVVTAVNGTPVHNISELTDQLSKHQPGDQVTVTVVRNGSEQQVTVTLQAWPEELE